MLFWNSFSLCCECELISIRTNFILPNKICFSVSSVMLKVLQALLNNEFSYNNAEAL